MDRRRFLRHLGITASAIAFQKAMPIDLTWFSPRDVIPHVTTEATPEWLAAEALAALEMYLDENTFKHRGFLPFGQEPNMQHIGVDVDLPATDSDLSRFSLEQLRAAFIEPAMHCLANEIIYRKPKESFSLAMPKAVEYQRRVRGNSGIDLRVLRALDMSAGWEDENGVFHARPKRMITRFDVALA